MTDLNLDFIKLLPNILHTLQNTTNNNSMLQLLGDINHHFPLISLLINPLDFENLPDSDIKYIILYKLYLINKNYERAIFNAFNLCRIRNEKKFESLFSTVFYEREICRQALGLYKYLNNDIYEIPKYFNKESISDLNEFIKVFMEHDIPFIDIMIEFIRSISFKDLIDINNPNSKLIILKSKKYGSNIFNGIKSNIGKTKFYFLTLTRGLNEFNFEEYINAIIFFYKNNCLIKTEFLMNLIPFEKENDSLISSLSYFFNFTIKSPFNYRIAHYISNVHSWFADLIIKELLLNDKPLETIPLISVLTNERSYLNRFIVNSNICPINLKIVNQFCKNTLSNIREVHISISIMNGLLNAGSCEDSFIRKNIDNNINSINGSKSHSKIPEICDLTKDKEIKEYPEFILYSTMGLIHRESDTLLEVLEDLIDPVNIQSAGSLFALGLSLMGRGFMNNKSLNEFYSFKPNLNNFIFNKIISITEILENNLKISNLFMFILKQGFIESLSLEKILTLNSKAFISREVLLGALKGIGCLYSNRGTIILKNESFSDFEQKMLICLTNYALKDLNYLSPSAIISIGQIYSATNDFKLLIDLIKLLSTKHERIFNSMLKCISMICLNGHEFLEIIDSKYLKINYNKNNISYKIGSIDIFWYILYENAIKNKSKKIIKFFKNYLSDKIEILSNNNDILKENYFINLIEFLKLIPSNIFESVLISIVGSTFVGTNNLTAISFLSSLSEIEINSSKVNFVIGIGLITTNKNNYNYFNNENNYQTYDALKSLLNSPDSIIRSTAMLVIGFSHTGTAIPEIVKFLYNIIQIEIDPIVLQSAQISIGLILNQNGNSSSQLNKPTFSEINSMLHSNFTSLNPSAYIHGTSLKFGAAISRGFMNLGHFASTISLYRNNNLCVNNLTSYIIVCDPLLKFDKWLYVNGLIKHTTFSIIVPKKLHSIPSNINDFFSMPHVGLPRLRKPNFWKIDKLSLKKKKNEDIIEEYSSEEIFNSCIANGKELSECGVESELLFEANEDNQE